MTRYIEESIFKETVREQQETKGKMKIIIPFFKTIEKRAYDLFAFSQHSPHLHNIRPTLAIFSPFPPSFSPHIHLSSTSLLGYTYQKKISFCIPCCITPSVCPYGKVCYTKILENLIHLIFTILSTTKLPKKNIIENVRFL